MNIEEVAYKDWSLCTEEERKLQIAILEKCYGIKFGKPDFKYFLKWCKILGTPTVDNEGGLMPFQILPHTEKLIDTLLTERLISIMKARQVWVSYTLAAYLLWCTGAKRGSAWLEFSKGEKEAFELLDKSYRLSRYLPPILKFKQHPDSKEEMGFPSRESYIKAMPSTESGGIGFTVSGILSDEHLQHPYAEQNYMHAKPAIENVRGQYISVFTPDKTKLNGLAFSIWRGAPDNGFVPLFFPYDVIPGRDEDWYDEVKSNLSAEELGGLTPQLYMESNYPRNIVEALRAPQTTLAFETTVLDSMIVEAKGKNKVQSLSVDPLIVNIYHPYNIGEYYIAGTDTSHGVGKDNAVTCIMNVKTQTIVADIISNKLSPEQLAQHSVSVLGLYNNPLWFIEDNDWGRVTITVAERLGYKNFGYQDEKKTKIGFHTSEPTRNDLWGALIPAVNTNQITIFNENGLKQFYDVIRNVEKNGRIEASSGRHDDYPIAVGICWLKRNQVRTQKWESKPIETLTFRQSEQSQLEKILGRRL